MPEKELLERLIKVDEDLVRVVKRLDTSFDRRMAPVQMQMEYHKMILFKVVLPIVVGLVLIVAASTETGGNLVSTTGNVIKSFIG